ALGAAASCTAGGALPFLSSFLPQPAAAPADKASRTNASAQRGRIMSLQHGGASDEEKRRRTESKHAAASSAAQSEMRAWAPYSCRGFGIFDSGPGTVAATSRCSGR